jgi:hypothetical protein
LPAQPYKRRIAVTDDGIVMIAIVVIEIGDGIVTTTTGIAAAAMIVTIVMTATIAMVDTETMAATTTALRFN